MTRSTRDGTAEPVSRDQSPRRVRGQGNIWRAGRSVGTPPLLQIYIFHSSQYVLFERLEELSQKLAHCHETNAWLGQKFCEVVVVKLVIPKSRSTLKLL